MIMNLQTDIAADGNAHQRHLHIFTGPECPAIALVCHCHLSYIRHDRPWPVIALVYITITIHFVFRLFLLVYVTSSINGDIMVFSQAFTKM
jgi:hypothetical protein